MIIRKNLLSLHATNFTRTLLGAAILTGMVGCSGSLSSVLEPERVDYKSASKAPTKSLEIPPNLTQLQRDNRYAVGDNRGIATASGYSLQQANTAGAGTGASAQVIAPAVAADMRVERAGNQRWLVTKKSPEVLWPQIKDFWQEGGFLINVEMPEVGVMETDWAEKRLNVPQGTVRGFLAKALDTAYDAGVRDKFRTRLERAPDGSTEIYISHRGAEEVFAGTSNSGPATTSWVSRASDPELEAQMLGQMMTRLGAEEVRAKAVVANASPIQLRSRLLKGEGGSYVEDNEGFDRAWRRVGLALDRVGFTVEDRDRSQGLYFVRYVDQDKDAKDKAAGEKGFFSKLLSFGDKDDPKSAQRYRISVKETAGVSRIQVLDGEGRPDTSATAGRILTLLNDQLK
ncbi:outer membrane protein assembly factor BamC [Noviherbaspirillum sedimenti]|uniref:Outer membrane protein assembly factor BamC n=1 Tax=Noviherbaspirillum sedimenti TaxID=2320865 RepID=A0A3A3FXZ3_9BURK|nr:outer membrane protein assembly factor BamC [Noviherbaspirillum sedimenti]RJG00235.1 outer membrane protein assembly factor BamC [Noviherbaspirillum sedimenti]